MGEVLLKYLLTGIIVFGMYLFSKRELPLTTNEEIASDELRLTLIGLLQATRDAAKRNDLEASELYGRIYENLTV